MSAAGNKEGATDVTGEATALSHPAHNCEVREDAGKETSVVGPPDMSSARAEPRGVGGLVERLNKCISIVIPPGGIVAGAFNLASTSVGAGILGLPLAANSSGLMMAIIYLVFITCMTVFSMHILGVAIQRTKIRTIEGISGALLGRWAALVVAVVRGFHAFSACVAYVISVADILRNLIKNSPDAPVFLKSDGGIMVLTVGAWLVLMLPFVIPRHIDSLRHFSTFAVLFMVYFVIVIVAHSCTNGLPKNIKNISVTGGDNANVVLFNFDNNSIGALGVFMFVYVCQINGFEVYWDMKKPSATRFTLASTLGLVLCFILYFATAFFGYLDFGKDVNKSILLMYDPIKQPYVMIAYIGVLSKLCASYAIIALSTRNAIYHAVGWDPYTVAFWKHCIAVIALSALMLLCGLFIPKIEIVLGFAGSITGGLLGFVLPALFVMYAGNWSLRSVGVFNYLCTYLLLLSGVIAMVFGTGATIYGLVV